VLLTILSIDVIKYLIHYKVLSICVLHPLALRFSIVKHYDFQLLIDCLNTMCAGLGKKRSSDARQQRAWRATHLSGQAARAVFMTTAATWGETSALMYNKLPEARVSFSRSFSPYVWSLSLYLSLLSYAMVQWFCSHIPVLA
jgi:hypothetical protein